MYSVDGNWPPSYRHAVLAQEDGPLFGLQAMSDSDCSCDEDIGLAVVVHRASRGSRVCRCGEVRVAEPQWKARKFSQCPAKILN
jgi:hypothetical protein